MNYKFLKQVSLFSHLEDDKLQAIFNSLEKHEVKKNNPVFDERDKADHLYIVFSGGVKLFKTSADGKEHIIQNMQNFDVIGEAPMFEGTTYPASCVTLVDTILFSMSNSKLLNLIHDNPKIALSMLALQAKRLREFTRKIEKLTLNKTEQRLADFITNQTTTELQSMNIQNLANYLGVTRESVSRIISKWIKLGFISKEHGGIIVLDEEALNNIAT